MEERIPTYEELDDEEKEVLDAFRQMKMLCDLSQFKYHRLQIENLIMDYEDLKKLREDIQVKYFSIYDELLDEGLIEGELDVNDWGKTRELENEVWNSELRLMDEFKTEFDMAIKMIESGEAEQLIIEDENRKGF